MNKFLSLIATLLIIPSLAFAQGECTEKNDQEWRDVFTSQPWVLPIENDSSELKASGTVTVTFDKNGTFKEHMDMQSHLGNFTMDAKGDWSIINAVLNIHLTDLKHSDTHNKKLNKILDNIVKQAKAAPDASVPLASCSPNGDPVKAIRSISSLNK